MICTLIEDARHATGKPKRYGY